MEDIQSKEDLRRLVEAFYTKARKDGLIGDFFEKVVEIDWEEHLDKITDFWETILFEKVTYQGNPMKHHLHLHSLRKMKQEHFNQWLHLFSETVDELFKGEKAHLIKTRALSISTMIHIKTIQEGE